MSLRDFLHKFRFKVQPPKSMTEAQILALPAKEYSRLLLASDTNTLFYIQEYKTGADAFPVNRQAQTVYHATLETGDTVNANENASDQYHLLEFSEDLANLSFVLPPASIARDGQRIIVSNVNTYEVSAMTFSFVNTSGQTVLWGVIPGETGLPVRGRREWIYSSEINYWTEVGCESRL